MNQISGKIKSILFDMDGTLIDPSDGIFDSLRYALRKLDEPQPPDDALPSFIGPPLRMIFSRLLKTEDKIELENAVALYRERYADNGLYRCIVYDDIFTILNNLTERGKDLYVATIKPDPYARKILAHTGLAPFFQAIHGSDLPGSMDAKDRLVKGLLDDHGLNSAECIMVGDRYMDIEAAAANGMRSIGVTYGFGTRQELLKAGALHIVDSPGEVLAKIVEIEKTAARY